ncbi:hypothetical protein VCR15J2_470243 [Vibrio coralliirubri]|nr:hypothetical protein VCR15J2_470243 [Vibrio coralliirubri]
MTKNIAKRVILTKRDFVSYDKENQYLIHIYSALPESPNTIHD